MARKLNSKFLYIRSADLDPPHDTNHIQTYLLRCPTCSRQTFTSLQGLLNHSRIGHGLEWGTHDECVRACAVVDPDLDLQAGIEVGLGPSGILPGLRSLFQMAVGARPQELEVAMADGTPGNTVPREIDTGSHLTRTLGLHQDTPALAPFLGKQAVRRGINIWDVGDDIVDVGTFETDLNLNSALPLKRKWRMSYKHRNIDDSSTKGKDTEPIILSRDNQSSLIPPTAPSDQSRGPLAPNIEPEDHNKSFDTLKTDPENAKRISGLSLRIPGSRFHFSVRVVLTDRSLWVPPGSSLFPLPLPKFIY